MKHFLVIFAVCLLLVGCINPYGNKSVKEYDVRYVISGEGLVVSAFFFNPETDITEEWNYTRTSTYTLVTIGGKFLHLEVEGIGAFQAQIWVDDVMVAETSGGIEGEPFYVEWMLE